MINGVVMLRRFLIANPIGFFIYSTFLKIKLIVIAAIVIITFWVLKGLVQAGVVDNFVHVLQSSFGEIKAIAQNCTPKIMNLAQTWDCIQHPPNYIPTGEESHLENQLYDLYYENDFGNSFDDEGDPYDMDKDR